MKGMALRYAALGSLLAFTLALLSLSGGGNPRLVEAAHSSTVPPLLTCPNLDGSMENGTGAIRVADILAVVQAFGNDYPNTNYLYMYDNVNPLNPDADVMGDGQIRVNDILYVVGEFGIDCPLVDTQVAQATIWAKNNVPVLENATTLAGLGYVGGSTDVPGQGKHYVNLANWDDTFDPAAPEGLVYDSSGRLAAQLYVVDGNTVGWIEDPYSATPGSCWDSVDNGNDGQTDGADSDCTQSDPGNNPQLDDVDIDPLAQNCGGTNGCSWATNEGWHLHYRLCTVHIGTPNAIAVPLAPGSTAQDCEAFHNSTPGGGIWTYNYKVGWMGHLWNHIPNTNLVSDINSTMNGRFADCYPDTADGWHWNGFDCPA